jgi:Caspase domain
MKRRQLLQSLGLTLATLGISQLELQRRTLQYGRVLAQDSRRKRALLVGISDYPGRDARDLKTQGLWYRLPGAVTDVELQRELLIHRFGFHTDDILVLKDKAATRDGILTAFKTHLLQGIQSDGDVAIFHYSGHGSNVIDPDHVFPDGLNGTIVPYDAALLGISPAGRRGE